MGKGLRRSHKQGAEPMRQGIIKYDVPVKDATITITGASGNGWGTVVIGDFPEGNILFLGAVAYLQFAGSGADGDLSDVWEGDFSVGSTATTDATLDTTDVNIVASSAIGAADTELSPVTRGAGSTTVMLDNTDGSLEINLSMLIDDAHIAGDDSVITINGHVQLLYSVVMND